MSDKKVSPLKHIDRRSVLLFAAWIGGTLLIGGLLGSFTRSYRLGLLAGEVNKVLAESGDTRRIAAKPLSAGPAALGGWFALDGSEGQAYVFTITRGGSFAACAALMDSGGRVDAVVPLSGHAAQLSPELPPPVYRFYVNRVEKAAGRAGR
ncbi:MAG: hypothetical protein LBG84_03880 [Treponema sp.]|nr:hypothetical protein [Treponema sp.]